MPKKAYNPSGESVIFLCFDFIPDNVIATLSANLSSTDNLEVLNNAIVYDDLYNILEVYIIPITAFCKRPFKRGVTILMMSESKLKDVDTGEEVDYNSLGITLQGVPALIPVKISSEG